MHEFRSQFSANVQKKIRNVSSHFNEQDMHPAMFDDDVIANLTDKISNAIPEIYIVYHKLHDANLLYKIIADEFILFQCQEDINSDEYAERFQLFTYELINLLDSVYHLESPYARA